MDHNNFNRKFSHVAPKRIPMIIFDSKTNALDALRYFAENRKFI
jgi:hypothetical protein